MASLQKKVEKLIADGSTSVYDDIVGPCEKLVVRLVVEHCAGNYVQASRLLGISRMTLRSVSSTSALALARIARMNLIDQAKRTAKIG